MNWGSYFDNKKVAIIGNAEINFIKENEYDIIIRMNEADYAKNRTDVLAMSHFVGIEDLIRIKPQHLMWMTNKRRTFVSPYIQKLNYYPIEWWSKLSDKLQARPSTGVMVIDWVAHYTMEWDYFGFSFDYAQIPTPPHDVKREEAYIKCLK